MRIARRLREPTKAYIVSFDRAVELQRAIAASRRASDTVGQSRISESRVVAVSTARLIEHICAGLTCFDRTRAESPQRICAVAYSRYVGISSSVTRVNGRHHHESEQ